MTNEPAVLSNFDPIAIGDEIAVLETEAQSKLADAKGEFASRSEKIAAILWEVKEHHPEHLKAICERSSPRLSASSRPRNAASPWGPFWPYRGGILGPLFDQLVGASPPQLM